MSDLTIITNNVPRFTLDAYELTPAERERFDYLDWSAIDEGRDSATFVRYKGWVYDLGDVMRTNVPGWDGIVTETFFSGVLFRYPDNDGERIICARYYT